VEDYFQLAGRPHLLIVPMQFSHQKNAVDNRLNKKPCQNMSDNERVTVSQTKRQGQQQPHNIQYSILLKLTYGNYKQIPKDR